VTLRVAVLSHSPTQVTLRFEVKDTGIGLAAADLEKLVLPFTQADNSNTRAYGGVGLGLSISQEILKLWDSELMLESELGKGATFSFVLQLARGTQPAPLVVVNAQKAQRAFESVLDDHHRDVITGASILVAEDNPINARVMAELLTGYGATVTMSLDGEEALAMAQTQRYDLILMDVHMAQMDGPQATALIRQLPGYAAVPIVMVTADISLGNLKACMNAGATQVLHKPFEPQNFLREVATLLSAGPTVSTNLDLFST
jgi:CheY-like chemotaxis protein